MTDTERRNSHPSAERVARKVDMSSLWRVAGFKLRMLDLRLMKSFSERIAETGLTPAAATVVLVVESNPGIPLGKLADALLVKRPNMTKLVKRLEARALVKRRNDAADKRSISLVLTPAGQRQAARIRAVQDKHDASILAALKPAERAEFTKYVSRILTALAPKGA
jgi:DNA-binding MarR family transcriptional regulator